MLLLMDYMDYTLLILNPLKTRYQLIFHRGDEDYDDSSDRGMRIVACGTMSTPNR